MGTGKGLSVRTSLVPAVIIRIAKNIAAIVFFIFSPSEITPFPEPPSDADLWLRVLIDKDGPDEHWERAVIFSVSR